MSVDELVIDVVLDPEFVLESTSTVVDVAPTEPVLAVITVEGPKGDPGPPGEGTQIFGETPAGDVDGVNTVYTTASPYIAASTAVYRNGLREVRGIGYFETGVSEITLDEPPLSTDHISIDYLMQ